MARYDDSEKIVEYGVTEVGRELRSYVLILGGLVAFAWFLEFIDWLIFHGALDGLGILPRQIAGLRGVLLAPVLHGGLRHLVANTLPFVVLGLLVLLRGRSTFITASLIIIVVAGLGTWLIGPANTVHIGASGLIFGYFGFLLLCAFYERSLKAFLPAALAIVLYGGMVWGVLPQGNAISWQSHFFGLLGGGIAAYLLHRRAY